MKRAENAERPSEVAGPLGRRTISNRFASSGLGGGFAAGAGRSSGGIRALEGDIPKPCSKGSDVGALEIWMAVVVGFFGALVLSLIGPAREFVALLAEITRWVLIIALAIGAFWLVSKLHTA